jgi:hypothetical protein
MRAVLEYREAALAAQARRAAAPAGATHWPAVCLVFATLLLLVSPGARLLVLAFPLMALMLAMYLYRRDLSRYLSVLCWLWFLTPLVRRLVDYRAGWIPATAVLLAPVLAACAPAVWMVADWRRSVQKLPAALLCVVACCVYATLLGLLHFGIALVFQDLVTWLAPICILLMLYLHRREAPALFKALETSFLYGTLVVSLYGLYQFFFLPQWDVLWIQQIHLASVGVAEPTKVRLFSTMNSPQILASFLAAGLLLAINARRKIRFLVMPLGLLCLLLSLSRSGWVAMAGGLVYLLFKLPSRQKMYLVVLAVFSGLMLIAALQNPVLQKVVSKRFDTLSNGRHDVSVEDRFQGYQAVLDGFAENPFGLGMGATPAIAVGMKGAAYSHNGQSLVLGDSTLLMVLSTMGSAGSLVLVIALLGLVARVMTARSRDEDASRALRAILVAMIAECLLDAVISGPTGFLFWGSLGFGLALAREPGDAAEPAPAPPAVAPRWKTAGAEVRL